MTKKIIIALIAMAALYGCKPKDPCDSEIKSDTDKYLLTGSLWFDIRDNTNTRLMLRKYATSDIKMYAKDLQPLALEYWTDRDIDKANISVKVTDILANPLLGTGEEFQCTIYLKLKDDIDTLQIWANIKRLNCNKDYTDRLQIKQNNLPTQNLILHNGEFKYNAVQPYNRGFTIIK